jgi:hypothetical protein
MHMKRICTLLLLLSLAAFAQEKAVVKFRLRKDPDSPMRGWLLRHDEFGFRYARFGDGPKVFIRWDELVSEDASRIRRKLGLELSEDERLGLVDGHEIFFKGGGSVRGLLVKDDEHERRYLFKSSGLVLPYPKQRVEHISKIKVKESEVHSDEEIYIQRLQRRPPTNAAEHKALADYMYDVGHWQKADEHYRAAIASESALRPHLEERLAEIKDLLEDEAAGATFRQAKSMANLHGQYEAATLLIELYMAKNPGAKRRGVKVIDEIQARRQQKMQIYFQRAKHEAFDRSVDRYLARRQPDIQEAMAWATSHLKDEIERRIRQRMNLSGEEYEMFREAKPRGAPHFASYWTGSFVISTRAKKGASTRNTVRGDPDSWWDRYHDVKTRGMWLKAYAAERLPDLFEIVQVRISPCDKCGGKGSVKQTSLKGLKAVNGGHEWFETCPRCYGAREDRAVAFR